jgi:hypothetical protein
MALDLMKNGTPIEDILGRDANGGLHPMSPAEIKPVKATKDTPAIPGRPGAVPQARAADAYLDPNRTREPGEHIPKDAIAHMEREIQLLHAWVNTLDLVFSDTATEREKIDEIKKSIKTRILGLSSEDEV